MTASEALIDVRDLTVDFTVGADTVRAVDGLTFTIGHGEVVALVGESGSGKSVSALSLVGLLPETASVTGEALLGDENLLTMSGQQLNSIRGARISVIFQDPTNALDPVFTIGSQVSEMLRFHRPELSRGERRDRVIELFEMVELPNPTQRYAMYPHQLSGGQAQRVMIAMALACEPELLIADEPTTALDVTVQRGVLDVMRRLQQRTGTSILMITHDMGVVADVADRVVVLRRGVMQECAAVEELFDRPQAEYTKQLLAAVPRLGATDRTDATDPSDRAVLRVENLSVTYGRGDRAVRAVDHVSFDVHQSETVALVGESGSGKSTIGRCALGLAPITSGQVLVDGVDMAAASRRQRVAIKKTMGVVFQNSTAALDPRLTVGASIEEPLRVHARLRGPNLASRVSELLESVELPASWHRRYPHELSGGQRQRIAIARAIALGPQLLIADEPTSALDVSVQATVLELLRHLQAELNFACLFISHDLAVVDELCDRVVVLHNGKIVESGTRSAVLNSPTAPYTRELLNSVPVPDPRRQAERRAQFAAS